MSKKSAVCPVCHADYGLCSSYQVTCGTEPCQNYARAAIGSACNDKEAIACLRYLNKTWLSSIRLSSSAGVKI